MLTLRVAFMGGFQLRYGDDPLNWDVENTGKMNQLLQLLLFYHAQGITREEVLGTLYGPCDLLDPANNLRNLRFRLKKKLEESGLPPCDWIVLEGDRLRWSPEIPVYTDVDAFEEQIQNMKQAQTKAEQERFAMAACQAWKGEMLPAMAGVEWIVRENLRLQHSFALAVRAACGALERDRRFDDAFALYSRAEKMDAYDEEWIMGQIRCEQSSGRHREALLLYERANERFLTELGIAPSRRFEECIGMSMQSGFACVAEIQRCIAPEEGFGAYDYTFSEFINLTRLVTSLDKRNGSCTTLLWCVVKHPHYSGRDMTKRHDLMCGCLKAVLSNSLRRSDAFAQYGSDQFLLLLNGADHESTAAVTTRIRAAFKACKASYGYHLQFHIVPTEVKKAEGDRND